MVVTWNANAGAVLPTRRRRSGREAVSELGRDGVWGRSSSPRGRAYFGGEGQREAVRSRASVEGGTGTAQRSPTRTMDPLAARRMRASPRRSLRTWSLSRRTVRPSGSAAAARVETMVCSRLSARLARWSLESTRARWASPRLGYARLAANHGFDRLAVALVERDHILRNTMQRRLRHASQAQLFEVRLASLGGHLREGLRHQSRHPRRVAALHDAQPQVHGKEHPAPP